MLESVAKQRTYEAAGAAPVYVPYVPQVGDRTAPRDLQEAADYCERVPEVVGKLSPFFKRHLVAQAG